MDELERNLLELTLNGMFEIINFSDINFKLTEFGKREAEALITLDPEMKRFWENLIEKDKRF